MEYQLIEAYKVDAAAQQQIAELLEACFPDGGYNGRTYFKQLPHFRLLLKDGTDLIGHIGLDYRVMALGGNPVKVMGLIDVAIQPANQGKGLGTQMLKELDALMGPYLENIDFLYLVAEKHRFYENCGYRLVKQQVKWLAIDQHVNYGIKEEFIDDCIMVKPTGDKVWDESAELDLLGYWY